MGEKVFNSDPYCHKCGKLLFSGDSYGHIPYNGYICMDCYFRVLEELYKEHLNNKNEG